MPTALQTKPNTITSWDAMRVFYEMDKQVLPEVADPAHVVKADLVWAAGTIN